MARLATCPTDRQQMEFFGIAHYLIVKKGRSIGLSTVATRQPGIKVTARWTMCATCGTSQMEDFNGRILKVRTDKWTKDEIEDTFPTEREKREKRKSK